MSEILSNVLDPEIILGRRGPPEMIKAYKEILEQVSNEGGYWTANLPPQIVSNFPLRNRFLLSKKFLLERPPVYRLGKDFGSLLAEVDKEIPVDKLPERFFGYISLPEGVARDNDGDVAGAYVFIGDAKETSMDTKWYGQKFLWASILGSNGNCSYISMVLKGSFEETFNSIELRDMDIAPDGSVITQDMGEESRQQRLHVCRCLVNTVLYINSLEPNIDHLRPMQRSTTNEVNRARKAGQKINLCSLPVVAINWNYKRERIYGVDETWRREHTRWQRCGPAFSQIKLITIKGHTVTYKTERETNGPTYK